MAPYRTVDRDERAEAPRDPGIVGEVIAQFADPLAFFRELVQNAIDAGSPAVEVRLEHDDAAQLMRASVRDRGEGMTREIIEQQLLVLFRSTKERDATKIGKFGIGFASVLAPEPRIVVVQTARDGRRLALHLHPDLTYQLFDAGPATQPGTTVQLELAMDADRAADFAARGRDALVRWCRHASVPIQLEAEVAARDLRLSQRIDRPLAIDGALVEVRAAADAGALVAVVGICPPEAGPYAGFFNHGLMLYETHEPLLGRLSVKIQDARLGHTLSRDNVRRDERFERAVAFARTLAEDPLLAAAAAALQSAAAAPDRARYHAVADAIAAAGIALRAAAWSVPLVEPLDPEAGTPDPGARWCTVARLGSTAWSAPAPSALTAALARANIPVLHAEGEAGARLVERCRIYGCRVASVLADLTSVERVAPAPREQVLLDELRAVLAAAHRAPSAIWLARLDGALAALPAITGDAGDAVYAPDEPDAPGATYVLSREVAARSPFAMLRRPPLVLSILHPHVAAACAAEDPRLAASHLARTVLLHYRLLGVERSAAILERTLDRVLDPARDAPEEP